MECALWILSVLGLQLRWSTFVFSSSSPSSLPPSPPPPPPAPRARPPPPAPSLPAAPSFPPRPPMVRLSLSTSKGNAGIRHFPFQGYLGLTPVRVDGLVRTRTDDDLKPVLAASLTVYVRAYESRQPRLGAPHHRVVAEYLHTVWRAPDGTQYAPLADFDAPFKITLPKRAPGFSTANFQDYRTFWRVEAGAYSLELRARVCSPAVSRRPTVCCRHCPSARAPSPSHHPITARLQSSSICRPPLLASASSNTLSSRSSATTSRRPCPRPPRRPMPRPQPPRRAQRFPTSPSSPARPCCTTTSPPRHIPSGPPTSSSHRSSCARRTPPSRSAVRRSSSNAASSSPAPAPSTCRCRSSTSRRR